MLVHLEPPTCSLSNWQFERFSMCKIWWQTRTHCRYRTRLFVSNDDAICAMPFAPILFWRRLIYGWIKSHRTLPMINWTHSIFVREVFPLRRAENDSAPSLLISERCKLQKEMNVFLDGDRWIYAPESPQGRNPADRGIYSSARCCSRVVAQAV